MAQHGLRSSAARARHARGSMSNAATRREKRERQPDGCPDNSSRFTGHVSALARQSMGVLFSQSALAAPRAEPGRMVPVTSSARSANPADRRGRVTLRTKTKYNPTVQYTQCTSFEGMGCISLLKRCLELRRKLLRGRQFIKPRRFFLTRKNSHLNSCNRTDSHGYMRSGCRLDRSTQGVTCRPEKNPETVRDQSRHVHPGDDQATRL